MLKSSEYSLASVNQALSHLKQFPTPEAMNGFMAALGSQPRMLVLVFPKGWGLYL